MKNAQSPERKLKFYRRMTRLGFSLVFAALGAMAIDIPINRVVYHYPKGFPKQRYQSLLDFKRHSELVRDAMNGELGEFYGRLNIQLEAPQDNPGYEEPISRLEENRLENVIILDDVIEHAASDINEVKEGYKSHFANIEQYSLFRRHASVPLAIAILGGAACGFICMPREDKYRKILRTKEAD